jgi:hypothetical protein
MSIILQSSGGGSITIAEPTTASNFTQTLPSASGTVMVSGNMPAFRAYSNAAQSISATTFTKVTFQVEDFDTNNNFDSSRFTPTVAGYYQISATVRIGGLASGNLLYVSIYKNGSANTEIFNTNQGAAGDASGGGSALFYMNGSTDYLEIYVYQSNASSKNTVAGSQFVWFTGAMVRAA